MASIDDVRKAADHLRIRDAMAHAPVAGLIVLVSAAGASYGYRRVGATWWIPLIIAVLILGPWLLEKVLPARGTAGLRFSIAAYPLNILLLAFIAYREFWRVQIPYFEDAPQLTNAMEWIAPVIPFVYAYLQFPAWLGRIRLLPQARAMATLPPEPLVVREIQQLVEQARSGQASEESAPAQFRTVPATPRNWRLFLKPDLFRHGAWTVAFAPSYALVFFEDGGRLEAVKRSGLRMVAADPEEGASSVSCLARWNEHLHEGVVDVDSFQRIQQWNQAPR